MTLKCLRSLLICFGFLHKSILLGSRLPLFFCAPIRTLILAQDLSRKEAKYLDTFLVSLVFLSASPDKNFDAAREKVLDKKTYSEQIGYSFSDESSTMLSASMAFSPIDIQIFTVEWSRKQPQPRRC